MKPLITLAVNHGWDVQVICTPNARKFLGVVNDIEQQTNRPVLSEHRPLGSAHSPKPDAMLVAPATFNSINKLAQGLSDNYALGRVHEAIDTTGTPVVILPAASAFTNRIPYRKSIKILRLERVKVLERKVGDSEPIPWSRALEAIETLQDQRLGRQIPFLPAMKFFPFLWCFAGD